MSDNNKKPDTVADTDFDRRDFLSKYGKLAVVTPVAVTTLMSPSTSAAPKSCRGNGSKRC